MSQKSAENSHWPHDFTESASFSGQHVRRCVSSPSLRSPVQLDVGVTSVLSSLEKFFQTFSRVLVPSLLLQVCQPLVSGGSGKTWKHGLLRSGGWLGSSHRAQHECQEKVRAVPEPQKRRGRGLDGRSREHGLHLPRDQKLRNVKKPRGRGAGGLAGPLRRRHGGEAAVHPVRGGEEWHRGGSSTFDRCVAVVFGLTAFLNVCQSNLGWFTSESVSWVNCQCSLCTSGSDLQFWILFFVSSLWFLWLNTTITCLKQKYWSVASGKPLVPQ